MESANCIMPVSKNACKKSSGFYKKRVLKLFVYIKYFALLEIHAQYNYNEVEFPYMQRNYVENDGNKNLYYIILLLFCN